MLLEMGVCYYQCVLLTILLLAFAQVHFIFQGQACLLLQVSPDFLLLPSSPLWWKGHLFLVLGGSSKSSQSPGPKLWSHFPEGKCRHVTSAHWFPPWRPPHPLISAPRLYHLLSADVSESPLPRMMVLFPGRGCFHVALATRVSVQVASSCRVYIPPPLPSSWPRPHVASGCFVTLIASVSPVPWTYSWDVQPLHPVC